MNKNNVNFHDLKRFGIMGGTFDPIHLGHLAAASDVLSYFELEKIVFMPTGRPPHKSKHLISGRKHRLDMTKLATKDNPNFVVSDMEIKRRYVNYTVDTFRELRRICLPDAEIFFIVGADTLCEIPTWKQPEELLRLCELIAVSRDSQDAEAVARGIDVIKKSFGVRPLFLQLPDLSISATEIRSRVGLGRPVKYFLPQKVEQYIRKHGLYLNDTTSIDGVKIKVRRMISGKRYRHTLCVAEEAVRLARAHGADSKKAYLAGILHDCAKEAVKNERICKKYGLTLAASADRELAHGLLAEMIAKKKFKVKDSEILAAIRNHTTGRAAMSTLEKIIFVADLIEPSREPYPELDTIRNLAYKNLDRCVLEGLKMKSRYTAQNGKAIATQAIEAIKFYSETEEAHE